MYRRTLVSAIASVTLLVVLCVTVMLQANRKSSAASAASPSAVQAFTIKRSSGLFSLPANAKSVDWMIVNDTTTTQTMRVTVFKCGVGAKTAVAPGPLTVTLNPNFSTHNANSVGVLQPFVPGFYYEVVVESNDRRVLPGVHVWQDNANTVIPGTLIPAADFVNIN